MVAVPEVITQRRLTLADHEQLPDDQDYEIIDGVLYVSPRPRPRHQRTANRLCVLLTIEVEDQGRGTVLPDAGLIIDERNSYVSPDIMVFAGDRFAAWDPDERIRIMPDLVVEFLSPGHEDYDLDTKRALYARLGVPHYWVADARPRAMLEHTLPPDDTYHVRIVRAPDVFRPAIFPDLSIDLTHVFQ